MFSILLTIRFSNNFILACLYVILCWAIVIVVDAPCEITVSYICDEGQIVGVAGLCFVGGFFRIRILGCLVMILWC